MSRLRNCALVALAVFVPFIWPSTARAEDAPATAAEAPARAAPAKPVEEEFEEEIVVTGTRIPRVELTHAAPVTVMNRAQIDSAGRPSIGDILQSLPEQANGLNTQVNNGGDGSVRLDLRGLGYPRTLVLLNGRRFVNGGTGADVGVDLTTIPTSAIQRVEILKDGASAVYGSDAIAGVINLITRKDYSGTEITAYYGSTQQGDGTALDLSATTGLVTDKGNLLVSGGFFRQGQVMAASRSFSKFAWGYDFASRQVGTQGSQATPQGSFNVTPGEQDGNAAWNALVAANPDAFRFTIDPSSHQWRAFNLSGVTETGGDFYNFQPENFLVTPSQRANVFAVGEYRFSPVVRGYFEASYNNRSSRQQLAPEPLSTINEGIILSRDSVYNPFGRDFDDVARRMVEVQNRRDSQDQDTFRAVTGVSGQLSFLPTPWTWDVSVNYGRNQSVSLKEGRLRKSKLADAVGPSFYDTDGVARCGTPGSPIDGCVPLNMFGGAGSISQDQVANLTYAGTLRGLNDMLAAQATVGGTLFRIGSAAPVGLAAGYELRREYGAYIPDPLTASGDTTGNTGSAVEGSFTTNEGYMELSLPLLAEPSLDGQSVGRTMLELSAAARVVNYNTFGTNLTYKLGGRVSPVRDVTLRGTYSTAFRAPNIGNLYGGNFDGFPFVNDPCSAGEAGEERAQGTSVDRACDAQNVPDNHYDDRAQLRTVVGGNPLLQPETANVFTVGAVLEPRWVKDLSFTVDYYNVTVNDAIGTIGAGVILESCYPGEEGRSSEYCSLIERNADHKILNIRDTVTNVGGNRTSGIDFAARYEPETPVGRFLIDADVTYLFDFTQEFAGNQRIEARGNYDLNGIYPEWKGNLGVSWMMDAFRAGARLRYIGDYQECDDNTCTRQDPTQPAPLSRQVGHYATVDATLGYTLPSPAGESTLSLGVNNLLNTQPPAVYNAFIQSDPNYDYLGRYFYARVTHKF